MVMRLLLLIVTLNICTPVWAEEWVDNWIQQSTMSRPNSYNTQKRGYLTGGKLSVRYEQDTDHLINISLPNYKKGCGGIDLFGGSISFLEADRLVDKFERIMSGALATYGFDLALNVLCEPCAKELKSLEAIVSRINQLQIDDCKATKAVVGYMKNSSGMGDSAENSEAITDFAISSGISPLRDYFDITSSANNQSTQTAMSQNNMTKHDMVSGCPDSMRNIFFTEGSLLSNMAEQTGIGESRVEFMRAMIGDIYISSDLEYGAVAPCPQNNPTNIEAIIYGDFYHRRNGACVKDPIIIDGRSYPSLFEWARENILEIAIHISNKEPFEPSNELFINTIAHPILVMISTDIMTQGNAFEAAEAADRYAYMSSIIFAHSMMRDFYNDLYNMLYMVKISDFNEQSGGDIRCSRQLKAKAHELASEMRQNVLKYRTAINSNYKTAINEAMEQSKYAQFLKENKKVAEQQTLRKVAAP
jgi:conjugative transfer pilus assembly protein TraH